MAFEKIREYLSKPPILASPRPKEKMVCYLLVSQVAVSSILMVEREEKEMLVYYASRMLNKAEA